MQDYAERGVDEIYSQQNEKTSEEKIDPLQRAL